MFGPNNQQNFCLKDHNADYTSIMVNDIFITLINLCFTHVTYNTYSVINFLKIRKDVKQ